MKLYPDSRESPALAGYRHYKRSARRTWRHPPDALVRLAAQRRARAGLGTAARTAHSATRTHTAMQRAAHRTRTHTRAHGAPSSSFLCAPRVCVCAREPAREADGRCEGDGRRKRKARARVTERTRRFVGPSGCGKRKRDGERARKERGKERRRRRGRERANAARTDGWTDGRTNGRTGGRTNGRAGG